MDSGSECLFEPTDIAPLLPPMLFNPLPLQCLAADALPPKLQEEIGIILDHYAVDDATIEPPPEFNAKAECVSEQLVDPPPIGQAWSSESLLSSPRHQMTFLLRRKQQRSSPQNNDFGIGMKIVGGMSCERCRNLHAVVTCVMPGTECAHTVREGMVVAEWCGNKLDGLTYESVLWLMGTTDDEVVEIAVREPCVVRPGSTGSTTTFQLRMSGHSSLKGRLSVFLGNKEIRPEDVDSDTSNSSSRRESTTAGEDQLEGYFASLPSGMIKLSIQYIRVEEKLAVGLIQVKSQCLKDHDEAAIFISVQIIPDERSQELKFAKLRGTPAAFHLLPTELSLVALRVTLWESMDSKSAFRGEVLLKVIDKDTVSLNGDPSWYTICSPDPNLPPLEDPFDYGKTQHVGKGIGTWHGAQRRALKALFKKTTSASDVHMVEGTPSPLAVRKTSLPSTKTAEADGMKLVFATLVKKMKNKYHSESQFSSPSQLLSQSNTQLSTSLPQSPAQGSRSQSPHIRSTPSPAQSIQNCAQSPAQSFQHSVQSPSESTQCRIPHLTQFPSTSEGRPVDREEDRSLEKLASMISTLRRELTQSDNELHQNQTTDSPLGGGAWDEPVVEPKGEPSTLDSSGLDTSSGGRSLLSYQGDCKHDDIEVCMLDTKKWSEEEQLKYNCISPNLGLGVTNRDLPPATIDSKADDPKAPGLFKLSQLPSPWKGECASVPPPLAESILESPLASNTQLSPPSSNALLSETPNDVQVSSQVVTKTHPVTGAQPVTGAHPVMTGAQPVMMGAHPQQAEVHATHVAGGIQPRPLQERTAAHYQGYPLVPSPANMPEPSKNSRATGDTPKCHQNPAGVRLGPGNDASVLSPYQKVPMEPAHFQSKHRSRSLNDILTSSGEESSMSNTSHAAVGGAPSRDVGVARHAAKDPEFHTGRLATHSSAAGRGEKRAEGPKVSSKHHHKEKAGKRRFARRNSLTTISPGSHNAPSSSPLFPSQQSDASPPNWHAVTGIAPTAHPKGPSWYSNLFARKRGQSHEDRLHTRELHKSKSSEDVLGQEHSPVKPHDQRRRGSHASVHPAVELKRSNERDTGLPLGSVQLSFSYSPHSPALLVTLTDMVLLSSKVLFSDFKLKMRILHTSSGVCLMKHKCSLSYKRGVVKPTAEFQFYTEIQNLSLQVLVGIPRTHMFSRKSYLEAWIDLNQLSLAENRTLSKWFEVHKQTTS